MKQVNSLEGLRDALAGGYDVELARGYYVVTEPIVVPESVVFDGCWATLSIELPTPDAWAFMLQAANLDLRRLYLPVQSGSCFNADAGSAAHLERIVMDGKSTAAKFGVGTTATADKDRCYGVSLTRCQIYGMQHGVRPGVDDDTTAPVNGWTLLDCWFDRNQVAIRTRGCGYLRVMGGCINASQTAVDHYGNELTVEDVHVERNVLDYRERAGSIGTAIIGGNMSKFDVLPDSDFQRVAPQRWKSLREQKRATIARGDCSRQRRATEGNDGNDH